MHKSFAFLLLLFPGSLYGQSKRPSKAAEVNVFLGTSGDHGQLSPSASFPFSMLSIGPQTYPNTHTGYEYKAKQVLGFTHNRIEGVGCMGSGGNLLIKPFNGEKPGDCRLIKAKESGAPGYYSVNFTNGIRTRFTVYGKAGIEQYHFPAGKHGFYLDFSHALMNGFIAEQHQVKGNSISGWIESGTTCRAGVYRVYYYLSFDQTVRWQDGTDHTLIVMANEKQAAITIRVALSSVSVAYAKAAIDTQTFTIVKKKSTRSWNKELDRIKVTGDNREAHLFYSLLYRTLQTPYHISEPDGVYRGTNGLLGHTHRDVYNGWSIWDNYRTLLPLLSIIEPDKYQDMVTSIELLYRSGKKDWATNTEPSNTVRTEHAIVVLLDAYRKGYAVNFGAIRDSLVKETESLDFSHPDKALESSYDTWAMSQVLSILKEDSLSKVYRRKALNWKTYWNKDFRDISGPDADQMGARGMYQGTVWQYRWFVPFDQRGLIQMCGGNDEFIKQLNEFFGTDYYNAANEPDLQAPYLYDATAMPWRSQYMVHKYAKDTVIQYYYDDNYRGIDPTIDRVFNNRPEAFVKSMDDDAGEMSSWYIMAACGLSPACVGWPVYYLHVPLFRSVTFHISTKKAFTIRVVNFNQHNIYIRSVRLNGKLLNRNWITEQEINHGGSLVMEAANRPDKSFGIKNQFITRVENK